jgi:thiol-disulfide isomerase/thioredoxin
MATASFGVLGSVEQVMSAALQLPIKGELPSLGGAIGWLNSPPLTAAGIKGKVVLIDFWTYTCINWLRQFPYVRAWAAKYRDRGLVVIGVHTPEFPFEKDVENVRRAVKDMRVDYPVAIDSDYTIWRAFNNAYWPALYSSIRTGAFDIITSARANTISPKKLSNNSWPTPERTLVVSSFGSMGAVLKLPPIGPA